MAATGTGEGVKSEHHGNTQQLNFTLGRGGSGRGSGEGGAGEEYSYDDDGMMDSDDALTAEFRHRLGLLPDEEEGLTEAFKRRIGLASDADEVESSRELSELAMPVDIEREATLSRFKFSVFVKNHFNQTDGASGSASFSKEPLKQPLLTNTKKNEIDRMASVSVSTAIKRFCKDISLPSTAPAIYANGTSVMSVVFSNLEHLNRRLHRTPSSSSASSAVSSASTGKPSASGQNQPDATEKQTKKYSLRKLFRSKSSKSNDGSPADGPQTTTTQGGLARSVSKGSNSGDPDAGDPGSTIATVPTAELDLVQYIVGHGILRRDLRDEIVCQLCCQVTKNPSVESTKLGWMLHVLCACCFMPSEGMLKFYFSFLNDVSAEYKEYSAFTKRMLHRTSACGLRYHPPTWLEYQATKIRKHIMLPVSLPNGRSVSIECDSAMTASEMCHKISTSVNLRDQFGFAIYIVILDKVSSLGNGSDHVMDAIAECEQLMRCHGKREEDSPWQLFFRKELFTPWHDAENDPVATELIYQQIVQSVLAEEYRLRSEEEVVRFVARRWYIEEGQELVPGRLQSKLHEFLPRSLLSKTNKSCDGWIQATVASFNELGFSSGKKSKEEVKGLIVDTAQRKWPLQFSALFEAYRVGGPPLIRNEVVFAVNCRGVFFLDEPYRILMGLHYYEIVDVTYNRRTRDKGPTTFSVITIRGDEFVFASPNAETIAKLLGAFLDGLRRRSRWAVSIQEFILQDHTTQVESGGAMFRIAQGDVLELLDEMTQRHLKEDWMYGRCERTGQAGSFPFDCVYIFPTCEKPPAEFLAMFKVMSSADVSTLPRKRGAVVLATETIGRHGGHGIQSAI